ncbi:MAG TPA: hypothetical protein VNA25_30530 [Phycisphaerae bacterium]|nr:hypothetical protein [Phycisphaerae bacterium]
MPQDALTDAESEAIEDALNTAATNEAEALEALEKLAKAGVSDKAKNAIKGALRLLNAYKDEVGEDVLKKLASVAGFGFAEAKTKSVEDEEKEARAKADALKKAEDEKKKAAGKDALPAEVLTLAKAGDYEAVMKAASEQPAILGLFVEMLKSRDDKIAELTKFQAAVGVKEDERQVREIVEEMNLPGMSLEDQVAFVKSMDPEGRKKIAAWAPALHASGTESPTTEIGSSRRGSLDASSAREEIAKRTKELVEKSDGKLDEADAGLKVLEDDPKLAARHRAELQGRG